MVAGADTPVFYFSLVPYNYTVITHNAINASGSSGKGVFIGTSSNNQIIDNNLFSVSASSSNAIEVDSNNVSITYNTVKATDIGIDFSRTRAKMWPSLLPLLEDIQSTDSILDLGCGNGRLLTALNHLPQKLKPG